MDELEEMGEPEMIPMKVPEQPPAQKKIKVIKNMVPINNNTNNDESKNTPVTVEADSR